MSQHQRRTKAIQHDPLFDLTIHLVYIDKDMNTVALSTLNHLHVSPSLRESYNKRGRNFQPPELHYH